MNLNWMTEPLAAYAAIMAGGAAAMHLFVSVKAELQRQKIRHEREAVELRNSLGEIEARLSAVAVDAERESRWRAASVAPVPQSVNLQKRSEALRLSRSGAAPEAIAARVGLSRADVLFLRKLHATLADRPSNQLSGAAQDRSSSFEYSLEA